MNKLGKTTFTKYGVSPIIMASVKSNYKNPGRRNLVMYFDSIKTFIVYDYYGVKEVCRFRITKLK
jgi:hypothetical protein